MKIHYLVAVSLLAGNMSSAVAQEPASAIDAHAADKANAIKTMTPWLRLNDDGKSGAAWKEAAPIFKEAVTPEEWSASFQQARAPYGRLLERKVANTFYTTSVPNPKGGKPLSGQWVIAQFEARFETLNAIETVTFEKGNDGIWRASGYYIKPGS